MTTEMTKRERILAAIAHQPVDRLPVDYWGVPEITHRLMAHFGATDFLEVCEALDIDRIANIAPRFLGREDGGDMWGIKHKEVPLPGGQGTYTEPISFPLAGFETVAEIEAGYQFPTCDLFDYSNIPEECKRLSGYAIEAGYISLTYFYGLLRGTEGMLLDFIESPDIARYVLHRLQEFSYEHVRRILEAGDGRIDIAQVTDDFGSQGGLLMSPAMIDEFLASYYERNIQLVKDHGAIVFHHDDGAIAELLGWLCDKGIQVLNPIQWHLPGWDLPAIKRDFGHQICFHGGVDNQDVLPFGTPADVRREVEACIAALFSDRTGYILAPCHNIQANTPIENVIEMYRHAHTLGRG